MRKKKRLLTAAQKIVSSPVSCRIRSVKIYPLSHLIKKKKAVDIQVHNNVIHLLSKKNGRLYVSARVYVFDWEWAVSRKNILNYLQDVIIAKGQKYSLPHWHITEYKDGSYGATLLGGSFLCSAKGEEKYVSLPHPPTVEPDPLFNSKKNSLNMGQTVEDEEKDCTNYYQPDYNKYCRDCEHNPLKGL